ncbi:MAG TPA: DUF2007 domain-containing protein [Acidimicrobiales bacterium]|nr:DUF2007 domain-containing protein [Acidimicrobiales bacterium]
MTSVRLVPLIWVSDPFEAKVLAARLGAEGIVWQLRGNVDSLYPVGGGIELLVDESDLDEARTVLALDPLDDDAPTSSRPAWPFLAFAVVVLVIVSWARLMAVT